MIVDTMKNIGLYFEAFPALEKIEKTVSGIKSGVLPGEGKIEIDGDKLFCSTSTYMTKSPEGARYEAHKMYADVQIALKGSEIIGWAPLSLCTLAEDLKDGGDIAFYTCNTGSPVLLNEDTFMLLLPEDAHMPCLHNGIPGEITKTVFKVKL